MGYVVIQESVCKNVIEFLCDKYNYTILHPVDARSYCACNVIQYRSDCVYVKFPNYMFCGFPHYVIGVGSDRVVIGYSEFSFCDPLFFTKVCGVIDSPINNLVLVFSGLIIIYTVFYNLFGFIILVGSVLLIWYSM